MKYVEHLIIYKYIYIYKWLLTNIFFYPAEKWPHCHPMKSGPCEVMEPPDRAIDALWGTMRPAANNAGIRRGPWTIDDLSIKMGMSNSYVNLPEDHEKYTVFLSPFSFPYHLVIGIYIYIIKYYSSIFIYIHDMSGGV